MRIDKVTGAEWVEKLKELVALVSEEVRK